MNSKQLFFLTFGLSIILFTGCDPYYPISITNKTNENIQLLVKENFKFRTVKQKQLSTPDGFDIYQLGPNERMNVGSAVAEIDNDLPFGAIKIIRNKDTISASNIEGIKNLFDKNVIGGLKTPYNISIK